jgi:histidyl-tRNA synthetase
MKRKLSNQPIKGASDWLPEEFAVRRYIFDTWRKINQQFGYEEYLTPIFESAEIYRAKSGEDVGGRELMVITDQGGRELAIRPEMTPSVMRMVTKFYRQSPKPLRLFSIANFWRNEKPQRGRNREFWQLNTDIFGSKAVTADLEILQVALQIMLAFNPPKGSFTLYLNHRHLIDSILTDIIHLPEKLHTPTVRLLDKFEKLRLDAFQYSLSEIGLRKESIDQLSRFVQSQNADQLLENFPQLKDNAGYQQITQIFAALQELGYQEWIIFNPSIIRGFDYYDGMVFEIFDNHPDNNRSMFGGGRYNGLANIFGEQDIPAVGFAPGDETTRLFLENWHLIPGCLTENQAIYLPLLDEKLTIPINRLATELRHSAFQIEQGLEIQPLKQALSYANKRKFPYIIIYGPDEASQAIFGLKDMKVGKQTNFTRTALLEELTRIRYGGKAE